MHFWAYCNCSEDFQSGHGELQAWSLFLPGEPSLKRSRYLLHLTWQEGAVASNKHKLLHLSTVTPGKCCKALLGICCLLLRLYLAHDAGSWHSSLSFLRVESVSARGPVLGSCWTHAVEGLFYLVSFQVDHQLVYAWTYVSYIGRYSLYMCLCELFSYQ